MLYEPIKIKAPVAHLYENVTPLYENVAPLYEHVAPVYENVAPLYKYVAPLYENEAPFVSLWRPFFPTPWAVAAPNGSTGRCINIYAIDCTILCRSKVRFVCANALKAMCSCVVSQTNFKCLFCCAVS